MRALKLLLDLWTCLTVLDQITMASTTIIHTRNSNNGNEDGGVFSDQLSAQIKTFRGRSFSKVSLLEHGEYLCYPLNSHFSGCHDDADMICPENCGRRSKRSPTQSAITPVQKFAQSQSRIEAIYFRDMRVQGLSFSDPESWKERRRKRWKSSNAKSLNPTNTSAGKQVRDKNLVGSQSLGKSQRK